MTGRDESRQDARGEGSGWGGADRAREVHIRDESLCLAETSSSTLYYLPFEIHKRYPTRRPRPLHPSSPSPPPNPNPTSLSPSTSAMSRQCAARARILDAPRPRAAAARRRARRDAPTAPGCTEAPPPRRSIAEAAAHPERRDRRPHGDPPGGVPVVSPGRRVRTRKKTVVEKKLFRRKAPAARARAARDQRLVQGGDVRP